MKKLIFLIFILTTFSSYCQEKLKYGKEMIRVQLEDSSEVLVSKYPITNREYLIFLIWNFNVFNENPIVYWKLIPGFKYENLYYNSNDFYKNPLETFKKYASPIYSEYFLNPTYLDYPVIGINYYQASRYNKWLQDRFNEYVLSKHNLSKCFSVLGLYNAGTENFVTESYLYGMFKFSCASSQLNCNAMECYPYLFPLFRLPTKFEINAAKIEIDSLNLETSKKKFDVIKAYENIFDFKVTDSSFRYKSYNKVEEVKTITESYKGLDSIQLEEITLDKYANIHTSNVFDIYKDLGYTIQYDSAYCDTINYLGDNKTNTSNDTLYIRRQEPDSLGQMPFIIVGNDKNGKPLCIENFVKPYVEQKNKFFYFRFVIEAENIKRKK